jgi:undecaprenyl pyrophosphate synthase
VIHSNCHLTISEVAEEVGISKTMCHELLTENLGRHSAETKFMLSLLSEDQKQNRVEQ